MMKKVFVLEKRAHIVSELQWQFEGESDWDLRCFSSEFNLFEQCLKVDEEEPVVIINLNIGKQECLQSLQRRQNSKLSFPVIVYSEESIFNLEWALRELGVVHIQIGKLEPDRIAKICRWHFDAMTSGQAIRSDAYN